MEEGQIGLIVQTMNITDILSPTAVKLPLIATEKRAVIDELVDLLADANLITDPDTLKQVVWEREQQRSTGIGEGLAIPHGKSNCSTELVMAIGRPEKPIDFQSVDGEGIKASKRQGIKASRRRGIMVQLKKPV